LGKNYEGESQVMYPIPENSRGKDLEKLIRQFKPVGARNTKIELDTHDGVTIRSIKSGSHRGDVIEGHPRVIEIKRMYAGEVKMFTVSLRLSPRDEDETRRSFLETFSSRAKEIKLMTVGSSTGDSPVESITNVHIFEDRTPMMPIMKMQIVLEDLLHWKHIIMIRKGILEEEILELQSHISDTRKHKTEASMYELKLEELNYENKRMEEEILELERSISNARKQKTEESMLPPLSSENWHRETSTGLPYTADNCLPTSAAEQHTMFSAALQPLPFAIAALVILLLVVLLCIYAGVVKVWPTMQLRRASTTATTGMIRAIKQCLNPVSLHLRFIYLNARDAW
jgi:hypothetical protein